MMKAPLFIALAVGSMISAHASTALFLGEEYQAQNGSNAGTIRGGNPASSSVFTSFLGTAQLTSASVVYSLNTVGNYAVWANMADPTTSSAGVTSATVSFGGNNVTMSISGWSNITNSLTSASGSAAIDGFGVNGTGMQSVAPRPGFASGSGSGAYIGTINGSGSDNIRNAVTFDLTSFDGGGVYSFGIFGGDLETGGPSGSPLGLLFVEFLNGQTETIFYNPDATLFANSSYTGNNNDSETYGNETTRFIGIADDTRKIKKVTFVVGDDDVGDNGDTEQLSFIAPMVFLHYDGTTTTPLIPTQVPEPGACGLLALTLCGLGLYRQRHKP